VHFHREECRGFTLIELIASITIVAILAAVALPRLTSAQPFAQRGYADGIAASLRQARAAALTSGCEVRVTVDAAGSRAYQRRVSATIPNHCATSGAWSTPLQRGDGQDLVELRPAAVAPGTNRQFVFDAQGRVAAAPITIDIGPHRISVDGAGLVQGP
jgi:prepilin-type N-terminal cleavage/methylation domain-containing protein